MKSLRVVAMAICLAALSLAGACSSENSADSPDSYERRTVLVGGLNVSFELPSDWEDFDREKMQDALADNEVTDELTDRMGVSSEQFRQMMASNMVLFVTAPHASAGFLGNVNVIVADGSLPGLGALELQYRTIGASDVHSAETTTEVGDGYSTTYTLDLRGIEIQGEAIVLGVEGKTVAITLSTHDADETARLAKRVRESLHKSL